MKRTFIGSCVALTGGTLLSGLSTGLWMLVASRVIQGFGVGGMATLAYAMIPAWIPRDETGRAYGHLNLAAGVGMLAGVPFGGMVAQYASWRWIFFSNAPFIAFLAAFAWFQSARRFRRPAAAGPLDGMGLALFSTILASVVFGFSLGCELGWTSTPILAADALALTAARRHGSPAKGAPTSVLFGGDVLGIGFCPFVARSGPGDHGPRRDHVPGTLLPCSGMPGIQSSIRAWFLLAYPRCMLPSARGRPSCRQDRVENRWYCRQPARVRAGASFFLSFSGAGMPP